MHFSWLEVHGGLTHFPVALLVTSLAFDVGATLFRQWRVWHKVAFWLLVAGVISLVPAAFTGWMTSRALFTGAARPPEIFSLHWRLIVGVSALAVAHLTWRRGYWDKERAQPGMLALSALTAAGVCIAGYLGGGMVLGRAVAAVPHGEANTARIAVERNRRAFPPALIAQGHELVVSDKVGCRSCHLIDGVGGKIGPDLSRIGLTHPDIAWQIDHLRNPKSVNPGSSMPAFDHLSMEERQAIAAWLVTRDGSGK